MASIEKRRDGYRVRWRDPNGRAHARQCPSKRIADQLLREVEAAVALGRNWQPPARVEIPSVEALIDAYLLDLCRTLAQGTVNSNRTSLKAWLVWLTARDIDNPKTLTSAKLEDFDAERARDGKVESTRAKQIADIERWWRWCWERDEYRPHMNALGSGVRKPQVTPADIVAPYWHDVDRICGMAKERAVDGLRPDRRQKAPRWRAIYRTVMLMRAFGLRVGQALRLEWEDFSFPLGTIRIRGKLGKTQAERVGRTLPLPSWLVAEMLSWEPDEHRTGLVVWVPARSRKGIENGTRVPLSRSYAAKGTAELWRELPDVRAEVYVDHPDHAFRRCLRTELIAARCQSDAVEYWSGRSTGTRSRYTDPRCHELTEIAAAIPAPPCVPAVSRGPVAIVPEARTKRLSA